MSCSSEKGSGGGGGMEGRIGGFRWITTKVTNACIPCLGGQYPDIGIHSVTVLV